MAEKQYLVGEAIKVEYISDGAKTGLVDVTMQIYDETGAKDIVTFPDVTMVERGTSGVYDGSFTPDVVGEWLVRIHYGSQKGVVIKKFSVGDYNLQAIGDNIAGLNNVSVAEVKLAADQALIDYDVAKSTDISSPPMIG